MFDKLKEEGDVGDKKAGSSSGETQKEVDIHVTQLDTTQDADYTFKPENAEHSTPVGTTAENRKRLFDEEGKFMMQFLNNSKIDCYSKSLKPSTKLHHRQLKAPLLKILPKVRLEI